MPQPWLIGKLMNQYPLNTNTSAMISRQDSYIYSSFILLTSFLSVMTSHSYLLAIQHLGMKIRISCSCLVYQKALKMSTHSSEVGKIINILSNDVYRLDMAAMHLCQIIVAPIETIVVLYCLYMTVGSSTASGIVFLLLFLPLQSILF